MMKARLALLLLALVVPVWDSLLHVIGLMFFLDTATHYGMPVDLPWLLWPELGSRWNYDLFWAVAHGLTALLLLAVIIRDWTRRPQTPMSGAGRSSPTTKEHSHG